MNALSEILPADRGTFLHEIDSDTMAPTHERNRHAAICVPVDRYRGDGIDLVEMEDGYRRLVRCQAWAGKVRLLNDNKVYSERVIPLAEFNTLRLALVAADITIRNGGMWEWPVA